MMRRMVLLAMLVALCFLLGGCLNIKPSTDPSTQEVVAMVPETTPEADGADEVDQVDQLVDEAASYEEEEEDLPEDVAYEFSDLQGEEYAFEDPDIPRTLKPATAAQQRGVIKVDYVIEDKLFVTQLDEIGYYPEDFIGKNMQIEGYVLYYPEGPNEATQFAVVRDFQLPPHEHGDGEELDHDHEPYAIGFDCKYNGTIPAENSWARVIGTVVEYDYIDPDTGEALPAVCLKLLSLEILTEPSGARTVTE